MTRITTISSGLVRVGKTHLAVNLALEMVRRGHQAAVFNQTRADASIDDLLVLPQEAILQRRSTDHGDSLVRRGYQGIDIISSGVPVSQWDSASGQMLQKIIDEMDITAGYDDFLVDTSSMDRRTQLACCRASSRLVLIITPDSRSQSEAFALLRILQLNGFSSDLFILVNRVGHPADVDALYSTFSRQLRKHLGLDVSLLGGLENDVQVQRAERSGQAFSSLFPDASIASQLVAVADAFDEAPAVQQDIAGYWSDFRDILALPVTLTGGAFLEGSDDTDELAVKPPQQGRESGKEVMLLQMESSFYAFSNTLNRLPELLHATADDISNLHCLLDSDADSVAHGSAHLLQDSDSLLPFAVYLLREIEQGVAPMQALRLQVNESQVQGEALGWLRAGCYLKYIFHFPDQEDILFQIKSVLAQTAVFGQASGSDGAMVWEKVLADHCGGINIIHTPAIGIRIQVWLPTGKRMKQHRGSRKQVAAPVLTPSKMIH